MQHANKIKISFVILTSLFTTHILASGASASVSLMTNYIWRGVSQTDNSPGILGDFSYAFSKGPYLGISANSVDFGAEDPAYVELDYYAGFAHDFNDDWHIDIGGIYYTYPKVDSYNYGEGVLTLGYRMVNLEFAYANNNFNSQTRGFYVALSAEHEIYKKIVLGGHIGHVTADSDAVPGGDYWDFKAYLLRPFAGFDWLLGWTDTSGREGTGDSWGDSHVYVSVSKAIGD